MKNISLIIIDRDNTINQCPNQYILSESELELKEGALEAFEIIRNLEIPVVLATRQKCIAKGLISLERVQEINYKLEDILNFNFSDSYVESKSESKIDILIQVLQDFNNINPKNILFIDDNGYHCAEAKILGMNTIKCVNLLEQIKQWVK